MQAPSCSHDCCAGPASEPLEGLPSPDAFSTAAQQDPVTAELAKAKGKGKLVEIKEQPPDDAAVVIDDLTCAICLEQMKLEDTAIVKGCEHTYCATCILSWKVVKEQAGCPQCKAPFTTLFTYRALDGTLRDFPQEESVCLLARAQWFAAHLKEAEKGKQAMAEVLGQPVASVPRRGPGGWDDYSRYFDEYDEDEEVENYYFSAAAGRARIVLGNRRWGENGYVSSGRQHARPKVTQSTGKAGKGKGSASKAKAKASAPSSAPSKTAHNAPNGSASSDSSIQHQPSSSPVPIPRTTRAETPATKLPAPDREDVHGASPSTPSSQIMKGWQMRSQQCACGAADAALGSSPDSACGGSDSKGPGRRARRAAKKAAADAKAQATVPGY